MLLRLDIIINVYLANNWTETTKSKTNMATTMTTKTTEAESALLKLTLAFNKEIHDQVSLGFFTTTFDS